MGGHNGLELEVKINILVPSHFHVTCIQSSVMYTKIRSATTPPPPVQYGCGPVVQGNMCGVSVYFGWVRVGLSELQFKFQLGTCHLQR